MTKKLYEISADLVQAQIASSPMSAEEIVESLKKVFNTLNSMQKSESEGSSLDLTEPSSPDDQPEQPQVAGFAEPMDSIQQDKIICLECGAEMRQLTAKHLSAHLMSIKDYKKKWGFPLKQSLSAKSLSKARSKAAKKRGLPPNLIKYREEQKAAKMGAEFHPKEDMEQVESPDVFFELQEAPAPPEKKEARKTRKK